MKLVPLLAIQRSLYDVSIPLRFENYLNVMLLDGQNGQQRGQHADIRYPLQNVNPMAKSHVPKLLDEYIKLNADQVATKVLQLLLLHDDNDNQTNSHLSMGLVLADDELGGWTDRIDVELKNTFQQKQQMLKKRGWIEALLWSSDYNAGKEEEEEASALLLSNVKTTVELAFHRTNYILQQEQQQQQDKDEENSVLTLKQMLDQEAWVWEQYNKNHNAKRKQQHYPSSLEEEKLAAAAVAAATAAATMEILKQHEDLSIQENYPTIIAAYFGDDAAIARGYPKLGLPIPTSTSILKSKSHSEEQWSCCCGKDICMAGLWPTPTPTPTSKSLA